jgi:hypothetical protein
MSLAPERTKPFLPEPVKSAQLMPFAVTQSRIADPSKFPGSLLPPIRRNAHGLLPAGQRPASRRLSRKSSAPERTYICQACKWISQRIMIQTSGEENGFGTAVVVVLKVAGVHIIWLEYNIVMGASSSTNSKFRTRSISQSNFKTL